MKKDNIFYFIYPFRFISQLGQQTNKKKYKLREKSVLTFKNCALSVDEIAITFPHAIHIINELKML